MPASLSAVLSVMCREGLVVGECTRVRGDELEFFSTAKLRPGDEVEFRLELDGTEVTVLGQLRVEAVQGPLRWRGRVLSVAPEDRETWERWSAARRAGRSVYVGRPGAGGGLFGGRVTPQTEAQRQAVARMDARRQRSQSRRGEWREDGEELFVPGLFD